MYKRLLILLLILSSPSYAKPFPCEPIEVGKNTLKIFGFEIYTARSLTCQKHHSIAYEALPKPFIFNIKYARNIKKEKLIEITQERWQALPAHINLRESWLKRLAELWPDIQKGDELSLVLNEANHASFYLDGSYLGTITDQYFGEGFLGIWLHPDTKYKKQRDKLLGHL